MKIILNSAYFLTQILVSKIAVSFTFLQFLPSLLHTDSLYIMICLFYTSFWKFKIYWLNHF